MSEETGISIAPLLNRIFEGETLERSEAKEVVGYLMDGQLSQMKLCEVEQYEYCQMLKNHC